MELQQKHSVTLNVYDIQEQAKTEDIYQTLQTPPTAVSRKVSNYHFRQSGEEDQKTNQEMWYLHDDTFYLFWSNHGDCKTAYSFCAERNANLATVTNDNRDWLQSQINGKRLLVKKVHTHGLHWLHSQDLDNDLLDILFHLGDHDLPNPQSESEYMGYLEPNCTFFGETSYLSEQVAGWVCERPPACFRGC
ncbi:uncharacterized protein LOC108259990 isoform X2 [Ictalurus punctatus]|uniref:Uncharacterized protein LOC108259990 isoform X2 n=1 Tax=Ictalurus punctatus TaxID=7998 RepID=A0A2D0Q9J1_ICTPU|nr:uncharacterized protein LOC108259990 isoform X2 [Ictalurus punctatus]